MVRRTEEMVTEFRKRMRDGDGTAEIKHIYKGDELKGNTRLCAQITLEPNASIGTHIHENEEEVYYILEGEGEVIDDGQPVAVKKGDAILTRDGASHSIRNTGNADLVFMAVINLY